MNLVATPPEVRTPSTGQFFQTLSSDQYQQLMQMFQSHLSHGSNNTGPSNMYSPSHTTGTCFSVSLTPHLSSGQFWIVDSGASSNICCTNDAFTSMSKRHNASVTLPNSTTISVDCMGDIQLNSKLTLRSVLFVPQFRFNLLSVSDLSKDSNLTVHFNMIILLFRRSTPRG